MSLIIRSKYVIHILMKVIRGNDTAWWPVGEHPQLDLEAK
jgi:hypothetical protein